MKRVLKNNSGSTGAVIVELALMLPLLTLLFLGVVDLGMVIWEHQVVQNAARAGARFASLPNNWVNPINPGASEAAIKQRVIDYLQEEGIAVSDTDISVTQALQINVAGLAVSASEVSVTYTRALLLTGGGLLPFPAAGVTLHGRSVFRNLY